MVSDYPGFQEPIRGGITGLDHESNTRFEKVFTSITEVEQKTISDEIAFLNPELNSSKQFQPIQFFSLIKNLMMTGYFTSDIGIDELGYVGNSPNIWDGVPQDMLDDHGLAY